MRRTVIAGNWKMNNLKEDVIQFFKELGDYPSNFKDRDIVPIDCTTLIKQHGSLHCVTMNFAKVN